MKVRRLVTLGATILGALALVPLAQAQATRTWVSGVGDDVNPCSRTAPCKTWAGAISKTARGGEIDALDPGGFGTLTVNKSITINGRGTMASTLSSGLSGITVNITDPADTNKTVIIKNMDIQGWGGQASGAYTGVNGIRFLAGNRLYVQNVSIAGFVNSGVDITGAGSIYIDHTTMTEVGRGVNVLPGNVALTAKVTITHSTIATAATGAINTFGVTALSPGAKVGMRDVTVSGANFAGVYAEQGKIDMEGCTVTNNFRGLFAFSTGAVIRASNSLITGNTTGVAFTAPGQALSRLNNTLQGNDTDGAFSGSYGAS